MEADTMSDKQRLITKLDKIRLAKQALFTNRAREIELFERFLSRQLQSVDILVFYGVGGIGKTELVDQFARICNERHIAVARLDGQDHQTVVTVVAELKVQLSPHMEFARLDKGLRRYLKIQGKLVERTNLPQQVIAMLSKGVMLGVGLTPARVITEAIGEGHD
jgi:hypothetical protein